MSNIRIIGGPGVTSPVDENSIEIGDSINGSIVRRISWANLKAALKAAFQGNGSASTDMGFRGIPQNTQSANYTTVLSDVGKHILHPSADTITRTFTIDSNVNVAYPIGSAITFVNQNGGGVITISITTDTMRLAGPGTTGSRTLAANGIATAIKVTSTEWLINGTGLT